MQGQHKALTADYNSSGDDDLELLVQYITYNFMTLMILIILTAMMLANRKINVPASGYIRISAVLLFLITIGAFAGEWASGFTPENSPDLGTVIVIHTAASVFCYLLRPFVILAELFALTPNVSHKFLIAIPALINSAIYAIAPFTSQLIFTFGGTNTFYRGPLGYTIYLTMIFYVFALIFGSIKRFSTRSRSQNTIIGGIIVITAAVTIMEATNTGPTFTEPVMALDILAYYMYLATLYQQEMRESLAEKELHIATDKMKLLQQQIRPHFIYNSLGVIRSLTKKNTDKAVECIDNFSEYLKAHIRAIQATEVIPFQKEIENVEAYLSLVQSDHDMNLTIIYDIRENRFGIPPLTLEPLVENAVKHGISKNGGVITISSFSDADSIVIRVTDDGSKPEELTKREQDRLGIGLENTRQRLSLQCGGTLELNTDEAGTTAEVRIPKEGSIKE